MTNNNDTLIRMIEGKRAGIWCPACGEAHVFDLSCWAISGTEDKPKIRPSMLTVIENQGKRPIPPKDSPDGTPSMMSKMGIEISILAGGKLHAEIAKDKNARCQYFITDGMIQYCGDCGHVYAGKTIQMIAF